MGRTATGQIRLFARVFVCVGVVGLFAGRAGAGQLGFVYALQQVNGGTNLVHGFRFDPATGALTLLPGFPVGSGGTGAGTSASEQLVYADGRLYVVNNGSDTLTAFSVDRSTGALTAMPFNPVALGAANWNCVAVHPSGSPVVVGNGTGGLASFIITPISATPAVGSPYATGANPFSCQFSQNGSYVYTGGNSGNSIAGFSVNAGTGVLTALAGSPFDSGAANPLGYATDVSGRLFSVSLSSPEVRAFATASGVPSGAMGNPFASGLTAAIHGVLHPGGFYMAADRSGNRVGSYEIAGTGATTTLTAVAGSPFATGGTFTLVLAVTADGAHLLAANSSTRNLTVFQVNQDTGALSSIGLQPVNTLGTSGTVTGLAFAESEAGFVYAFQDVDGAPNRIHGFRINPSTGALIPLAGFPISSGGNGTSTGASEYLAYGNGRLYAVNDGSDTLTAFKVNRTTGALTPLAFSPIALGPRLYTCVAVHPGGSPVVVGALTTVASFSVGASSVSEAAGSPYPAGDGPFSCHFGDDGNHVYTGGLGTEIAGFSVNAATGVLTALPGSPFDIGAAGPLAYATDSSGRLFAATAGAGEVQAFTTAAGVPTAAAGNPFASGLTQAVHGVRHPSGYYMVADREGDRVGVFQIGGSGAGTTLTPVGGSPFASGGNDPNALALTDDGRFLIAVNADSLNLTVFRVNPAGRVLATVGTQPAGTLGVSGIASGVVFAPVAPPFIDDPVIAATSVIRAVHVTELRTRIDAVRVSYGMAPYAYTDPALTVTATVIQAAHVSELRAALTEVYVAMGIAPPVYTDPVLTSGATVVKAAHISELRSAVIAIE